MANIFDLMTAEPVAEEYNAAAEVVSGAGGGPQARIAKWTVQRLLQIWGAEPLMPETFGLPPADGRREFPGKGSFFFWNPVRREDAHAAAKNLGAQNNRQFADEVLIASADVANILNGGDKDISASVSVAGWPGANGRAPQKFWTNAGFQLMTLPSAVQAIAVANGLMKPAYDYNNLTGVPQTEDAQLHFIGTDEAPGELIVARAAIWKALGGGDNYKTYTASIAPTGAPDPKSKTNVTPNTALWQILRILIQGHKPFDLYAKVMPWAEPPTPDVLDKNGKARSVPLFLEAYKNEADAIKACGDDYVKQEGGKKMPQAFVAAGLSEKDFKEFLTGILAPMPTGSNPKEWIRSGSGIAVMKANSLENDLDVVAEWL